MAELLENTLALIVGLALVGIIVAVAWRIFVNMLYLAFAGLFFFLVASQPIGWYVVISDWDLFIHELLTQGFGSESFWLCIYLLVPVLLILYLMTRRYWKKKQEKEQLASPV